MISKHTLKQHKSRQYGTGIKTDQWDRIRVQKKSPNIYGKLLLNRAPRKFNRDKKVSWKNGARTTGYPQEKEWGLTSSL